MRINKFSVQKSIANDIGLESIEIKNLGCIVALIGKNGAGKSRVLRVLEENFFARINNSNLLDGTFSFLPKELNSLIPNDPVLTEMILLAEEIKVLQKSNSEKDKENLAQKANRWSVLANSPQHGSSYNHWVSSNAIKFKEISSVLEKYVMKIDQKEILSMKNKFDNNSKKSVAPYEKLLSNDEIAGYYDEFKSISHTGLDYFEQLPTTLTIEKFDCMFRNVAFENMQFHKDFNRLKDLFNKFLGINLDYTYNNPKPEFNNNNEGVLRYKGWWKIDGVIFDYDKLSPGQQTLFAYCLLFFLSEKNKNIRVNESIIIIDEPELHLHAESEIKLIDRLRELVKEKGQLWIATHSLSILSHLSYNELFLVSDKKITANYGTSAFESISDLAGVHLEKLSHFMSDLTQWAYFNYMMQNLDNPDEIETAKDDDPQFLQLKESLVSNNDKSILLDFGAGKGRILKEINKDDNLSKRISKYYALNINDENDTKLNEIGVFEIFHDYTSLPNETFDYILLCNVLHEIQPISKWPMILNKLKSSLKEGGYFIIMEDLVLPKGEWIDSNGFIVMDAESLKLMFDYKSNPIIFESKNKKYKERLLCAMFKKENISTVTNESLNAALSLLKESTFNKLVTLRTQDINNNNRLSVGRENAFYSQLYINCIFAQKLVKA